MPALHQLLNEIIDYAGLFPPASLPLAAVIKNYEKYQASEQNWMLARLIIPATQLPKFAKIFSELFPEGLDQPQWKISALVPPVNADEDGWKNAWQAIHEFNSAHSFAVVDTIEGKLPTVDLLPKTIDELPDGIAAFLEIPLADQNASIEALSKVTRPQTFAKIRTGGVTEDLIPESRLVANFIASCAAHQLGFKATAGLHHPIRNEFPLTYHSESVTGTMHGFLNVFVAASLAKIHQFSAEQLVPVLNSSDGSDFSVTEQGVRYRDVSISAKQCIDVRQQFAISFGSCSFIEPVEELTELGWLANDAKTV